MSKRNYVYFKIPLSIKKEYSSNMKDGESEIKHVQIGKNGDRLTNPQQTKTTEEEQNTTAITTVKRTQQSCSNTLVSPHIPGILKVPGCFLSTATKL
jgi:hypothetical protein